MNNIIETPDDILISSNSGITFFLTTYLTSLGLNFIDNFSLFKT